MAPRPGPSSVGVRQHKAIADPDQDHEAEEGVDAAVASGDDQGRRAHPDQRQDRTRQNHPVDPHHRGKPPGQEVAEHVAHCR